MRLELVPTEWSEVVTCSRGHRAFPMKNQTFCCKRCNESVTYQQVSDTRIDLLRNDDTPEISRRIR